MTINFMSEGFLFIIRFLCCFVAHKQYFQFLSCAVAWGTEISRYAVRNMPIALPFLIPHNLRNLIYIFINGNCVSTWWQWSLTCTKLENNRRTTLLQNRALSGRPPGPFQDSSNIYVVLAQLVQHNVQLCPNFRPESDNLELREGCERRNFYTVY